MWTYNGLPFNEEEAKDWYGFIYEIRNTKNGRRYIGRKFFTGAGTKQVNGKKKKIRKDSDWRTYYGSSDELKADVALFGKESFEREILILCKTRGDCNYQETKMIFLTDALLKKEFYNSWASCKIHAGHVKNLWIKNEKFDVQNIPESID